MVRGSAGFVIVLALLATSGLVVSGARSASAGEVEPRVLAIAARDFGPYHEAVAGFRRAFEANGRVLRFESVVLEGDRARRAEAIARLRSGQIDLVFVVGEAALQAALEADARVPIVATFVTPAASRKLSVPISGVFLGHAPASEAAWIHRVLPAARSVGIVFTESANRAVVAEARKAASALSLTIEAEEIRGDADLPVAVESLARRVDALWALQDSLFESPLNVKKMLLLAFQFRLPVVGLSPAWVKAGALLGAGWDYADLGGQSADIALRILDGTPVRELPMELPRKVPLLLNWKTARALKIDVPASVRSEVTGGDQQGGP